MEITNAATDMKTGTDTTLTLTTPSSITTVTTVTETSITPTAISMSTTTIPKTTTTSSSSSSTTTTDTTKKCSSVLRACGRGYRRLPTPSTTTTSSTSSTKSTKPETVVEFRESTGCCRTSDMNPGTFTLVTLGLADCLQTCEEDSACVAIEWLNDACEFHTESVPNTQTNGNCGQYLCFQKIEGN
eukprot:m.287804 g.287804  ORF g.287804 m.287804 type:complete len:186 (+) comp16367_c0_seq2:1071-1628(+)